MRARGRTLFPILVALAVGACARDSDDSWDAAPLAGVDAGADGPVTFPTPDANPLAIDASLPLDAALDAPPTLELPAIGFDAYHTQEEIADYLRAVAAAAPELTHFEVLGASALGREIAILVINATGLETPPAVYINGTHHGNEPCSTEATLAIIDTFLRHRDDPEIAELLDTYAIYVHPLVNPDGHAIDSRYDAYGRDPNRDYAVPGKPEEESFFLVETQLVRDLQLQVGFRAAIALHSGTTGVLWPWGWSLEPTEDHDLFHTISRVCAEAMGFDRYIQSAALYPSAGEYSDYAYMVGGTLAVTVELSDDHAPSTAALPGVVAKAIDGTVAYLHAVRSSDRGALSIEPELELHLGTGPIPVVGGVKLE